MQESVEVDIPKTEDVKGLTLVSELMGRGWVDGLRREDIQTIDYYPPWK